MILDDGVLAEVPAPGGRVVLWMRGDRLGGYQHWDRVGTVAHAEVATERGIRSAAVATTPTRQWVGGPIGGLIRRLGGHGEVRSWLLPGGGMADQCGPRQTGLVLAWAEDDADAIDESRVRARWEGIRWTRPIGRNLHLVCGVEPVRPQLEPRSDRGPDAPPPGSPRQLADRALAAARGAGDVRREVEASADLALACLKERDPGRAGELLEASLAGARRIGDRGLEVGILVDLGLVTLEAGRPADAREILMRALALARELGDRHAEKLAFERLGRAQLWQGDRRGGIDHFERARAIAADLGDASHEADLLWLIAVEADEMGARDRADACARAAIDRMRRLGRPQVEWFAHHLAEFQSGMRANLGGPRDDPGGIYLGASIDTNALAAPPQPSSVGGPSPLRMAYTAASSMAKFLGSGFKVASREVYEARAAACASCGHHTGLRCRVCGCFTAGKARAGHERCPLGKWPA